MMPTLFFPLGTFPHWKGRQETPQSAGHRPPCLGLLVQPQEVLGGGCWLWLLSGALCVAKAVSCSWM